jgi:hypothetical protein
VSYVKDSVRDDTFLPTDVRPRRITPAPVGVRHRNDVSESQAVELTDEYPRVPCTLIACVGTAKPSIVTEIVPDVGVLLWTIALTCTDPKDNAVSRVPLRMAVSETPTVNTPIDSFDITHESDAHRVVPTLVSPVRTVCDIGSRRPNTRPTTVTDVAPVKGALEPPVCET